MAIEGRKRHLLVDSLGLLLTGVVTAANTAESQGLRCLLEKAKLLHLNLQRLYLLYTDGGYKGFKLVKWVMDLLVGYSNELSVLAPSKGFQLLRRRWVVERTFGWFYWCRRLSRDYEYSTQSAEAWIYLASIRLLLRRLA